MKVKDIMYKDVIKVKRSTNMRELFKVVKRFHTFPHIPVVDEEGKLVGVIYFENLIGVFKPKRPEMLKTIPFLDEEPERDIEDIFASEVTEDVLELVLAEDIMEKRFLSLEEETSVEEAYRLMKMYNREQLPVIDKDHKLVGLLGIFDIILTILREKKLI